VQVLAISEPLAYLPVGIVHGRPTAAPINAVRPRRAAGDQSGASSQEVPGPKLLLDLSLIAPRPTESDGRGTRTGDAQPVQANAATATAGPTGPAGMSQLDLVA
jgi:hypothetical protein